MEAIKKYKRTNGWRQQRQLTMDTLIFRSDFHKCRKIFRALLARVLLISHAVIAIWLASKIDKKYLGFFGPCIMLFLTETIIILHYRTGCEWKRICTCFIAYLTTIVPVLWLLRLDQLSKSLNIATNNVTMVPVKTTTQTVLENIYDSAGSLQTIKEAIYENSASYLEQSMMFLIIICRWLLPRGRIDRNSISQLLIMYSATSADILDFSEIMDQDQIKYSEYFKYVVLGVWSWSLVQFTIVLTISFHFRNRRVQPGAQTGASSDSEDSSEKISILMIFIMQDGPFLATRVYAIFWLRALDYQIIFFSLKNLLTIVLGVYRLLVLYGCVSREGNDLLRKSEIARSMESLDDIDSISVISDAMKKNKKKKKGKKDKKSKF